MSRNQLKTYAPKARTDFIRAVSDRAKKVGITGDDQFEPMVQQGDVVLISGQAFPKKVGSQRKALENRVRQQGFQQSMEEIAYTWFNRFAAIRYMELHGYLDHGYRVLSHSEGKSDPEILEHAQHVNLSGLNKEAVVELKLDGTKDEQLYRMLLVAQCNALSTSMPFLFERIDDESQLLLPDNLLHSDSVIRKLVSDIEEVDWQKIEIIGWLYQFFISEKKDEVIGKVVKSEDIPAATQLFTPNWIVKYMVQNSLGHQWLATYPESSLKGEMEYYIKPADQTADVHTQLAEITPKELNPEELTLLDPAAGSGHILVEAYDLFKQIYLERGYRLKDIPRLILEKNLYGFDIDERAAQMAGFSLLMKSCADDRNILSNPVHLNVMAIQSSEGLDAEDIAKHLLPSGRQELVASDDLLPDTLVQPTLVANDTSKMRVGTIESLINLFENAKTFGSLITVPENIQKALPALRQLLAKPSRGDLLQREMREYAVKEMRPLVGQAEMLGRGYDCVVANPPYMGNKGMSQTLKDFTRQHFPESSTDLFSCFIARGLSFSNTNGNAAFVTPFVWMFLSSYEPIRRHLISDNIINNLVQLEYNAFEPACIPVCIFTLSKSAVKRFTGTYIKLSQFKGHELQSPKTLEAINSDNCEWKYFSKPVDFLTLPGSPFCYWTSKNFISSFQRYSLLGVKAVAVKGLDTCDNDQFMRIWSEVSKSKIGNKDTKGGKWFSYAKGGKFRRWYGNLTYVVNWENDGYNICNFRNDDGSIKSRPQNVNKYFKKGITFNALTSSLMSCRALEDSIFGGGGNGLFVKETDVALALLNSKLCQYYIDAFNPTLNILVSDLMRIPFLSNAGIKEKVAKISSQCVSLSKRDWDSFETSLDFRATPTLTADLIKTTVGDSCSAWEEQCRINIETMKNLEEENNCLFIEAYGLQDELTPDVPEDQITLARSDREEDIKCLISYAIGCMMGRYSLAEEGLIYANSGNGGFDLSRYGDFTVDDDGTIPITDTEWFDDDATLRFEEFLNVAWSPESLKENLKFIGDSLANNGESHPLKIIRNYLSKGFYKDHLKTYKKRPIYWLFSSGKLKAFECLVYLHRYNEGTLARMRVDYVIPLQGKINARIEQLNGDIASAPSSAATKKLQKEQDKLILQKAELAEFNDKLHHYADQRIVLDLDDGVKVNYRKFGDLLTEAKVVTGEK